MTLDAAPDWPKPVEIVNPGGRAPFLLICEHASCHIPSHWNGLGLPAEEIRRHIGWDIGAAEVARGLSAHLDAPLFLAGFSRLLIDLNRPLGTPGSIPARSEATEIPGNQTVTPQDRAEREARIFHPFHTAVSRCLDARAGRPTAVVAIHSFTPVFHGAPRPWHAGVLYRRSSDWGERVLARLRAEPGLVAAANQPYEIEEDGDYAIPVHGEARGHEALLIEIRNDLIAEPQGAAAWAERLARVLPDPV